jgi:hypothetical protein
MQPDVKQGLGEPVRRHITPYPAVTMVRAHRVANLIE